MRYIADHGTAQDAIDFLLNHRQAPGEETTFLECWTQGDLEEWPEFYTWLETKRQQLTAAQENGQERIIT